MNSDTDRVVKPIKQLIKLSLGEITRFQFQARTLDKQLHNTHNTTSHVGKQHWHHILNCVHSQQ